LILSNPAKDIKRRKIVSKPIEVPSREQFQKLVAQIRESDGRAGSQMKAKAGADLVELLAYPGCLIHEGISLKWADVDFDKHPVKITGGERGTKNHEERTIPMTDALRSLLLRLKDERQTKPEEFISQIDNAKKCLQTACRRLG
jgi:integrase